MTGPLKLCPWRHGPMPSRIEKARLPPPMRFDIDIDPAAMTITTYVLEARCLYVSTGAEGPRAWWRYGFDPYFHAWVGLAAYDHETHELHYETTHGWLDFEDAEEVVRVLLHPVQPRPEPEPIDGSPPDWLN